MASPCPVAETHQGPLPFAKASWVMSSSFGGGSGARPWCRCHMERLSLVCPKLCPQPSGESPSQGWQAPPQTGDAARRGRLPQTHLLPSIRLLHRGAREIGKGRAEEGLLVMGGGFGVPSGRVSSGTAVSALCDRASPTRAKILAPVVQSRHDCILASHQCSSQPCFSGFSSQNSWFGWLFEGRSGCVVCASTVVWMLLVPMPLEGP